jgi:phospholipid/cholesterol/gamma-HCH transport system substrate-binding protein
MKKETGNRIRLGVFVTVGLGLFIIGIFFIGQKQRLFSHTVKVKFNCRDVNGLQAGNNVRFSGITVGTVQSVQIVADTLVRVTLMIDKSAKKFIKKDAQASVGSEGLMGDKIVNVAPGNEGSPEIENGDVIQCAEGSNIEEILAQVKVVAQNAAKITDDLADITGGIRDGKGAIGRLFTDSSFSQNLNQTMVNLKQGTKGFEQNMEAAKHNILLRGYFKKKEKEKEEKEKAAGK